MPSSYIVPVIGFQLIALSEASVVLNEAGEEVDGFSHRIFAGKYRKCTIAP